jgi:succinate dehydrogenase / fumarate reductase iron-sulfur subunit
VTVSALLDLLNYTDDLYDTEGNPATKIRWECSCVQAVCGGCAMVINGTPALACNTFIDEVGGEGIILEPLSKFPVVSDLIVDRSSIFENLVSSRAFLDGVASQSERDHAQQYSVAKCLKCGLCLEICPNFRVGGEFYGAAFANESYLIASQIKEKKSDMVKEYKKHFGRGCSKALSCRSVCPAGIETLTSILRMNRK